MSKRYIDADALYKETEKKIKAANEYRMAVVDSEFLDLINDSETADVVEVVRCRDCAHYHEMEGFEYKGRKPRYCVWHNALRGEDDYCSEGERREENEQRLDRQ